MKKVKCENTSAKDYGIMDSKWILRAPLTFRSVKT
jgi:cellobiose-specific phosphotransferase system component IIB